MLDIFSKKRKTKKIDISSDDIPKLFKSYVIPAIFSLIAMNTATMVDSFFIGNYIGPLGLGALTLIMPYYNLYIGLSFMILIGSVVQAAIAKGKNDIEESVNYFNHSVYLSLLLAFLSFVVLFFFKEKILIDWQNVNNKIQAKYILEYAGVINYFMLFYTFSLLFNFYLKLEGLNILIVKVTVFASLLNIALDYLLLAHFDFGMGGAAFASGMSFFLPFVVFLYYILKESSFKFKIIRLEYQKIKKLLLNGISEFLTLASVAIIAFMYNDLIRENLGVEALGAYSVAHQIAALPLYIFYGVADGVQPILSYNYGAYKIERIKELRKLIVKSCISVAVIFLLIALIFGSHISSLFLKDVDLIKTSAFILNFFAIATLLSGINLNASTYFTSLSMPLPSAVISVFRNFLGLILSMAILPKIFSEYGIWLPIIVTEVIAFIIVAFYVKKQKL